MFTLQARKLTICKGRHKLNIKKFSVKREVITIFYLVSEIFKGRHVLDLMSR